MDIHHVALWTNEIEILKQFYCRYFNLSANSKYTNERKSFESYFLTGSTGAKLELMTKTDNTFSHSSIKPATGFAHVAFSVGSEIEVDSLTKKLESDGYDVVSEPRRTGDGFYESSIRDPGGNLIEITI